MTLKENAITVAIAILFTVFILVSVDAFYERPRYEDFCKNGPRIAKPLMDNMINCSYKTTEEEMNCYEQGNIPEFNYENGCPVFEKCDSCNKEYQDAEDRYSNNLLIILAIIGVFTIFFGVYYKIEFLGTGFMFAGIILMFYGTVQNFRNLNKFTRVFVVFIELFLVLFIAYKKVIPEKKKK